MSWDYELTAKFESAATLVAILEALIAGSAHEPDWGTDRPSPDWADLGLGPVAVCAWKRDKPALTGISFGIDFEDGDMEGALDKFEPVVFPCLGRLVEMVSGDLVFSAKSQKAILRRLNGKVFLSTYSVLGRELDRRSIPYERHEMRVGDYGWECEDPELRARAGL